MLETVSNEKRKREELKVKRNLLFEQFLRNPTEIRLALQIRSIDNKIAESSEKMQRSEKGGTEFDALSFPDRWPSF